MATIVNHGQSDPRLHPFLKVGLHETTVRLEMLARAKNIIFLNIHASYVSCIHKNY